MAHFWNGFLDQEHANSCHDGASTSQDRVWAFSLEQIPVTSLPNNNLSSNPCKPRFVFCPQLHLSVAFLGHLAHFLTLPWNSSAIKIHSQSSHKTWHLSAAPDSCHSNFYQQYNINTHNFLCCLGMNWAVAHEEVSSNMSKRAWVHKFAWFNTTATRSHSGN